MINTFLVITSIAGHDHPVLNQYTREAEINNVEYIVIGDKKSPKDFFIEGCDFYSIEEQEKLDFKLSKILPKNHYARKNIGYLLAISKNAEIIIETDDDNIPKDGFWNARNRNVHAGIIKDAGWTNAYRFFSNELIWPRGFALEKLNDPLPKISQTSYQLCPIQQGLADDNPDVDAIYRLTLPLPIVFNMSENIILGKNSICPFNSQNTTWFKEAFALMYLPYYCSFRMTDIWRSFIAQRIGWTCGWSILFHKSTVSQVRNEHNLIQDFKDEIPGYLNNLQIMNLLQDLDLKEGSLYISSNMIICYEALIGAGFIGGGELELLNAWLDDVQCMLFP